jgi:hypothetical protein
LVYEAVIPLNGTAFLVEWESFIDPLRGLRESFEPVLNEGCRLAEWFVRPTFETAAWLRRAAHDDGVAELFRESRGSLFSGEDHVAYLRDLVVAEPEGPLLTEAAGAVLLGVAILASAYSQVGPAGVWLAGRFEAYYSDEQRAARRKAREDSSRPTRQ